MNSKLDGVCTYKGQIYEVWEVSDETLDIMCDMTEEQFIKLCPDGMWRYSDGSVLGNPDIEYEINGKILNAWDDRRKRYMRDCETCTIKDLHNCQQTEEDYNECFGERKYKDLLEYLCDEIGVSSPRNVVAVAKDLAKANNMTLGELFNKYEGECK